MFFERGTLGSRHVADIENVLHLLRSVDTSRTQILATRAVLRAALIYLRVSNVGRRERYFYNFRTYPLWSVLIAWVRIIPTGYGSIFSSKFSSGLSHNYFRDRDRDYYREYQDEYYAVKEIYYAVGSVNWPPMPDKADNIEAIRLAYIGLHRLAVSTEIIESFLKELFDDINIVGDGTSTQELFDRPLWQNNLNYNEEVSDLTLGLGDQIDESARRWFFALNQSDFPGRTAIVFAHELFDGIYVNRRWDDPFSFDTTFTPSAPIESLPELSMPVPTDAVTRSSAKAAGSIAGAVGVASAVVGMAGAVVAGAFMGAAALLSAARGIPNALLRQRAATTTEATAAVEGTPGARYTDVSIFAGVPARLGTLITNEALIFAKPYTLDVAIRHVPIGLPSIGAVRTDVAQFLSQTVPSELLAVLTSDIAPGDMEDIDIPNPVQSLVVPSIGDSNGRQALFQITPLRGSGATRRCNLILRLYYKLDLIDQLRISILIGPKKTAKDQSDSSLPALYIGSVEARTLPDFALSLVPRSLNIVVSRPRGGSRTRLDFVIPEDNAHFVGAADISNDELESLLSKLRDRLLDIAMHTPGDTIAIDEKQYQDQLRKLAQIGEQAKQLVFDFNKTGPEASLRKIEHIINTNLASKSIVQIALDDTANDFRFPWSILFNGSDPRAADKISDFWGYRFVIEEKPARLLLNELCFI
jgi:hypothetical protein